MAKKRTKRRMKRKTSTIGSEISDAAENGKLLIGSNSVLRELKRGGLESVVYATNIPEEKRIELDNNQESAEIKSFEGDAARLGESCGKPFNVLLIGIKK